MTMMMMLGRGMTPRLPLRTFLTCGPYRSPSVGGRPPRRRGQPRRPSRGRRSERKGGPVRGPQKGDPPSLWSHRQRRWRRTRLLGRLGPRWRGRSATPTPKTLAPSSGVRTRGQMASMAKKTQRPHQPRLQGAPGRPKARRRGRRRSRRVVQGSRGRSP
jgi:hypothetical protein